MDFGNVFESIWNMAKGLIQVIGVVWEWLTNPLNIDIPLLSDIPGIGNWFQISLDYSPIELIGIGIGVLLVLWVVKNLIPLS